MIKYQLSNDICNCIALLDGKPLAIRPIDTLKEFILNDKKSYRNTVIKESKKLPDSIKASLMVSTDLLLNQSMLDYIRENGNEANFFTSIFR